MSRFIQQRGLTLIELMISVALSLLLMLFFIEIMMHSQRLNEHNESVAEAQENGRFILKWLQASVRKAGYPGLKAAQPIQKIAQPCMADNLHPNQGHLGHCSYDTDTHNNGGDRLAIQRVFDNNSQDNRDCSDAEISIETNAIEYGQIMIDVFWVEPPKASNPLGSLWCSSYNEAGQRLNSKQEIATGIDSMHVVYGVQLQTPANNATATTYYESLTRLTPEQIRQVRSIRIAVLTRASSPFKQTPNAKTYQLLDALPLATTDNLARSRHITTIFLPN